MKFTINSKAIIYGATHALHQKLVSNFTMANPAFTEVERAGRYTGNIPRTICFCQEQNGTLVIPRGAARDVLTMAKAHGAVQVVDQRMLLPVVDMQFNGSLRAYQEQAVMGILSKEFGVLEAGTGSGKTVMALAIIAARQQPTLILVHTKELLYQWQDRIQQFLGVEAGLVGDGNKDIRPITVAIINTARKALDQLQNRFGHLVVDECHRAPSAMFTEVVTAFPARFMLGLSATPYRRDGLGQLIGWYLGLHRVRVDMAVLHEVGAVLKPKIINRETGFWYGYKDDYSRMLTALTEDKTRNQLIATDIQQQAAQGGLSLVVSDRVAHLEALADLAGVGHELLIGKTAAKKRRSIVETLAGGEMPVLFSTLSLIGEGFDCPVMDSLFLASPIKFSGRLKQVVGRVLRPAEGKQPLVYDYADVRVGVLQQQWKSRQRVFKELGRVG